MSATHKLTNEQKADVAKRLPSEGGTSLAKEYGVSRQTIYRARDIVEAAEEFATEEFAASDKAPLGEFGSTGLSRFGGQIQEDYSKQWRDLERMVPLVEEMLNHPTISSMMFSIDMFLAGAEWVIRPASNSPEDEAAAQFLRECKDDLSHSWSDFVSQVLTMLPYGFAPFEICYKRRTGKDGQFSSKYKDGRIGWRKMAFRSQDTVWGWEFDKNGGIEGMLQKADWTTPEVFIPIEKMLLFRTGSVKNNPQGRSALRACFEPWYYSKTFQELSGIAAERMGAGLPVVYLGDGTTKAGANSDFEFAKKVVRDVRIDEQAGICFPFPKQGADGRGVLFELVSPPSKGAFDWNETIQMYNQQVSQTLLNQIIWLGVGEGGGAYALGVELRRIFEQSIKAYGKNIADTINRWGVSRLFEYNTFNVEELPRFELVLPENVDMLAAVNALNAAATGNLLTVDASVEQKVRELLQLPEQLEQLNSKNEESVNDGLEVDASPKVDLQSHTEVVSRVNSKDVVASEPADIYQLQAPDEVVTTRKKEGLISKIFKRSKRLGKAKSAKFDAELDTTWEEGVTDLQKKLGDIYRAWIAELTTLIAAGTISTSDVESKLLELQDSVGKELASGLAATLPGGFSPEAANAMADELRLQLEYLETSFIPETKRRIMEFLSSPEGVALELGVLVAILGGLGARLASYAGSKFKLLNALVGLKLQAENKAVFWRRDPAALSCSDCLQWGDRQWPSINEMLAETGGLQPGVCLCGVKCRCTLQEAI